MCSPLWGLLFSIPLHRKGFYLICYGDFFLLLPKQLQAWKGIRHRATSNLLACRKKKTLTVPETKKKTKKVHERVDGKGQGRKKKALAALLIGFYVIYQEFINIFCYFKYYMSDCYVLNLLCPFMPNRVAFFWICLMVFVLGQRITKSPNELATILQSPKQTPNK